MVELDDVALKLTAEQPSDKRHKRLKTAEEQSDCQRVRAIELFHAKSLADRNRKRVHGKPDGYQNKLDETQKKHPLKENIGRAPDIAYSGTANRT